MDQVVNRAAGATPSTIPPAAAPRLVGEFQGYVDGADGVTPSVRWFDRKNMPQVGDKMYALPPRAAVPRSWSILLTSANHGTVGPLGSAFPHAGERHERVQVMEIVEAGAAPAPGTDLGGLVRITIDGTVIPLAAPPAPVAASTVLTDERINELWDETPTADAETLNEVRRRFARAIEREVAAQAGQVAAADCDAAFDQWYAAQSHQLTNEQVCRLIWQRGWQAHAKAAPAPGQVAVPEGWSVERVGDAIHIKRADGRWCGYMHEIDSPAHRLTHEFLSAMLAADPSAPAVAQQAPADSIDTPGVRTLLTELAAWSGAGGMIKANEFVGRAAAAIRQPAQASTSGERQEGGQS